MKKQILLLVLALAGFTACAGSEKKDIEVVAVYYPHWHVYPKGNEWFHPGWTEWEFVKSAKRYFPGHKQPLRPLPGYLNGADPKDVEVEIALASNAGIDVFLYDYYWYGGKITQEEAIEKGFLKASNRNRMKFALMWCYHERLNQFRPAYGKPRPSLMALEHTPEEFLGLIDYSISHYFNQPEYWKKDGKLFFSVYNTMDLFKTWGKDTAKVRAALDEARRRVRAAGLGELHMNAQNCRPNETELALTMGFDSLTSYGFGTWQLPNFSKRYKNGERLFNYGEIDGVIQKYWADMRKAPLPFIPIVPTGWDSTPRCRPDIPFPWSKNEYPYCATFTNNTPDLFEKYLRDAKVSALADPKKPGAVYINAWNEYTEGCYLLPSHFDTDGFLRAIAKVFGRQPADEYTYINPSTKKMYTIPAATHENVPYGTHQRQKLDVFLPGGAKDPTPVLIYLHGGGWNAGAMEDHFLGTSIRKLLGRGIAVIGTGYRYISDAHTDGIKPPVKACLDDCENAVKFVKAHAKEWNLDISRLALAGGSAGACTALYLGLKDNNGLGIIALGPIIAQTSIDPVQMKEWIPNSTYGAHAFGYRTFGDWLANRDHVLPWIEKFSPAALANKIEPSRAPKIFLEYGSIPKQGELAKDPTHSGTFGTKFKEICDKRGIFCEVFTGKTPHFRETFDRLADVLKKN